MQIRITGRHLGLTEDIRELISKRVEKLETFYDRIIEAQVVVDQEDNRYFTEITLKTNQTQLHADNEDYDVFVSINATMDKIEKQIRRRKDKIKDRRHKTPRRDVAVQLSEESKMEVEEQEEEESPSIVRVNNKFAPKPISVEEAVMELNLSGDNFLLFMNAETEQITLLYLRNDGSYGLVEPNLG